MKTRAVHFLIWDSNDIGVKSHCLHRGDFSYFINVAIKEWLAQNVSWEQPPQPVPAPPPAWGGNMTEKGGGEAVVGD